MPSLYIFISSILPIHGADPDFKLLFMNTSDYKFCGFHRVASIVPDVKVADVNFNVDCIKSILASDALKHVDLAIFPELSITGYTCADLFLQPFLIEKAEEGIRTLLEHDADLMTVVGAPVAVNNKLYNCAVMIYGKEVVAIVPKTFIPNYGEFYERRWFESASGLKNQYIEFAGCHYVPFGTNLIINYKEIKLGAEICEDLWTPVPPSSFLAMHGADIIVNLSASNAVIGKQRYRRDLILQQSARCRCVYMYASAGLGESSTDLAFPGYAAVAENGAMLSEAESFTEYADEDLNTEECRKAIDSPIYKIAIADVDVERLKAERIKYNTFCDLTAINSEEKFVEVYIQTYEQLMNLTYKSQKIGFTEDEIRKSKTLTEIKQAQLSRNAVGEEIELISRYLDRTPFVPSDPKHRNENCTEIISIQCHGLLQRLRAIGYPKMIIGVSGGLDSTLALLVAVRTAKMAGMSAKDVIGITMPGLATTNRTHNNAWQLMEKLGCTALEIPIGKAVAQHFSDIGQDQKKYDATYENSQARERTQILMDYANKAGGIVIGTGDLSELALGWCTYNGDHISMYAVNTSVPKTLVEYLVEWFALKTKDEEIRKILFDIIDTPISPELVPAKEGKDEIEQKTEDLVGPYELHDFFLFHTLRNAFSPKKIYYLAVETFRGVYDDEVILHWLKTFYRRFFNQQFKRSCLPDGPKVGSVCLSPRGDWRMPSDASSAMWHRELEELSDNENSAQI